MGPAENVRSLKLMEIAKATQTPKALRSFSAGPQIPATDPR